MANGLSLPHKQQIEDGYCLPACAQMALLHLGITRSQQEIGRLVRIRRGFGTPAPNIANLRSKGVEVYYQMGGKVEEIRQHLDKGTPVIAFVQAGELPHWAGVQAQHSILIVGMDATDVIIHDPALDHGAMRVSIGNFLLAWDEMDRRYAVIFRRT